MDSIIELKQVSKTFKDKKAVDRISFRIAKGSIVAILGPNGAGKTTALSMILGLLEPTEGEIRVFGKSPKEPSVRHHIGAMLQEVSLMDRLKVREVLELIRCYYPDPMDMDALIAMTGLHGKDLNRYTEKLSGGQKRNLGFALAMAGNPDLLFFDEPTVGLDIGARRRFWDQIREFAKQGKTILFTTHYLQEADDAADRILLFHQGALVADGTPEQIKSVIVKRSVSFLPLEDGSEFRRKLTSNPVLSNFSEQDGRIVFHTDHTDQVLEQIFAEKLGVRDIAVDQGRLDEAFEQLTSIQEEAV